MSATYARGGLEQATADRVMVLAISIFSAILVIAGLFYATGTSTRHRAALAAAGCEPNLSPSGLPCTTTQMLASQFQAMTTPAVQQLATDASAYSANERQHLGLAEAALTAEVTSENALATSLARFPFPPAAAPAARALIKADQARATLTAEQARSASLTRLLSFSDRVRLAGAAFQAELKLVVKVLNTRPTASQEP
jgi:hypothetical protein